MNIGKLRALFAGDIAKVDGALDEYLGEQTGPTSHYDMVRYHLGVESDRLARGKRLRAIFCLLIGRAAGADEEAIKILMASIELAHSASLVHDDIQDGEPTRWGRPTVWARHGVPQAINVGDSMIAMVYNLLLRLAHTSVPSDRVFKVLELFSGAHMQMCEGQHLDMLFEGRRDITEQQYLAVIAGKTAATTECAAHTSAVIAGLDPAREDAFRRFGHAFGMLYQIADDCADIWGNQSDTGKSELSDLQNGKVTLPYLIGLRRGGDEFDRMVFGRTQNGPDAVRMLMSHYGVDIECQEVVADYLDRATCALTEATDSGPQFHMLTAMTQLCAARAGIERAADDVAA